MKIFLYGILMLAATACNETIVGNNFAPGVSVSEQNSSVVVSAPTVHSGASVKITVDLRDQNFSAYVSTLPNVSIYVAGGTSTGTLGSMVNNADGTYSETFTGNANGTPLTIHATVDGNEITHSLPTIQVVSGADSLSQSLISLSSSSILSGGTMTATLTAKDASGNDLTTGGLTVLFYNAGGTSSGSFTATTDLGNGTYTSVFTGTSSGSATTVYASINGSPITSSLPTVTVSNGAIHSLVFTTPENTPITTDSTQTLVVKAYDVGSNLVNDSTSVISLNAYTNGTCSGGAVASTLSSTSATLSAGVASFSSLEILSSSIQSISASIGSVSVCSSALVVNGGTATQLVLSSVPVSTTAGSAFNVTVTAEDAHGNIATNYAGSVGITSTDASAGLPASSALTNGVGVFSVNLKTAASKTITATDGSISVTSTAITVNPGAYDVAHSIVTASVGSLNSGSTLTATLTAKDASGNLNPSGLPAIGAIAFTSTSVGGTGTFGAVTNAGSGVYTATFTAVTSGSVTLGATISGNAISTNATVNIGASGATQLVLTTIPASTTAGSSFNITVTAKDSNGNTSTSYAGSVSITSSDGIAGLPLASTLTSGTKTFAVTLKTAGSQTVSAGDGSLSVTSSAITVNPAAYDVTHSGVTTSLSSLNSGSTLTATLTAKDTYGNANPSGLPAIASIAFTSTATGGTGTFGTVTNAGSGVYTSVFTAVNSGSVTIGATISAVAVSTNSTVSIGAGGATQLVLSSVPSSTTAGSSFNITVTAKDSNGNTATSYAGSVSMTSSDGIAGLPPPSNLTNGVGVFSVILKTSGSKTVSAGDGTLSVTSSGITVNPGAYDVTQSVVTTSLSSLNSGSTLTATLSAKDTFGNANPTGLPAVAAIAFTSTSVGGTGTFGPVTNSGSGTYTSTFTAVTSGSVTIGATISAVAVSNNATVSIGASAATQLVLTTIPASTTAGSSFNITVTAKDSNGNTATSYGGSVSITSSDGIAGLPLASTLTSGTKTFAVTLKTAGSKTVSAGDGSLSVTSSGITVNPGAYDVTQSIVTASLSSLNSGSTLTATLTAKDSFGNSNPTGLPAVASIAFTSTSVGGTGTFGAITNAGAGVYTSVFSAVTSGSVTLGATISTVAISNGASVSIGAGGATQLTISSAPSSTIAGASFNITVTAKDLNGNTATSYAGSVSITSSDGAAGLPTSSTLTSGTKMFAVTLKTSGSQTVSAGDGTFSVTSSAITVSPGAYDVSHSVVTASVGSLNSGTTLTATLTAKDGYGNANPTGLPVLASILFTSSSVGGTGTYGAVSSSGSGVYTATFTAVKSGSVTLGATISTVAVSTNANVSIGGGTPTQVLTSLGNNQTAERSTLLPTAFTATVEDAAGNVVSGVTMDWLVTAGGGALSSITTSSLSDGTVTAALTLGAGVGSNTVTATIDGTSYVGTFTATGTATNALTGNTWSFANANKGSFTYGSTIDFNSSGGVCELAQLIQTDDVNNTLSMSTGFNAGTSLVGVTWDTTHNYVRLSQTGNPTNNASMDSSWAPNYSTLVSYYSFENNWTDSITTNSMTASGSPTFSTSSKVGAYSATFGGTSDYASIATAALGAQVNNWTMSAWIYPTDVTTAKRIAVYTGLGGTNGFGIASSGSTAGRVSVLINNTWVDQTASYTINTWQHVVAVRNSGTLTVYLNGVAQSVTSATTPVTPTAKTYIGWDGTNSKMKGSVDEVGIWSTALTSAQVQALYTRQSAKYSGQLTSRVMDSYNPLTSWTSLSAVPTLPFYKALPASNELQASYSGLVNSSGVSGDSALATGLIGLWHLDETSGTTTADSSGNNNTGTIQSGVTLGSPGKISNAMNFTNSYINIPNSTTIGNLGNTFTVSAWIYPTALVPSIRYAIFSTRSSNTAGSFQLEIGAGVNSASAATVASVAVTGISTWLAVSPNNSIMLNQWQHITYVRTSSGNDAIYINGVLQTLQNETAYPIADNSQFKMIGMGTSISEPFVGAIDEAAVWNRALASQEVEELYRRGANRIKYQVRTCTAATCSDDAAGANWKGPDGSNQSYYSELDNTSAYTVSTNTPSGTVNTTVPSFTFASFATPTPSPNRYFQYRAILESDDTSANCNYGSATWCSPELKSVAIGPTHYDGSGPAVYTTATAPNGINFYSLTDVVESLGANHCSSGVVYNLGFIDSSSVMEWYYWDTITSKWLASNGSATQASSATTLNASGVMAAFNTISGVTSKVYLKAYLQSTGTSPCELSSFKVDGFN
jgi:hypothetical protein